MKGESEREREWGNKELNRESERKKLRETPQAIVMTTEFRIGEVFLSTTPSRTLLLLT
jgi:hypothetical protein